MDPSEGHEEEVLKGVLDIDKVERGVALISEFNRMLISEGGQMQFHIQVVKIFTLRQIAEKYEEYGKEL